MKNFCHRVINKLLEIFFPEECVICKIIGQTICHKCLEEIKNNKAKKILSQWIIAPLNYQNENLKQALFSLKYYHNKNVAKYLAKVVYKDFLEIINGANFTDLLIVPIPISKQRKKERNYNQSQIIIQEILKLILEKNNLDLINNLKIDLLLKNKDTVKFSHTHTHGERENLIQGAFEINSKYNKEFLKNKKIILIDDITTSGATFFQARKTLLQHGALLENISALAIAH